MTLLHALPRLGAVLVPLDARAPAPTNAAVTLSRLPKDGTERDIAFGGTVDPGAVHSVIHTSGTTGRPRPVELTYANHHASASAWAQALNIGRDDRWLCCLPVHHIGGLAVLLRAAVCATPVVVHERFDAERVAEALARGEATLISLVPTMLERLREAGLARAPSLRAVLLGGGPVDRRTLEWAAGIGLPVRPTYGMTETASGVAVADPGRRSARPLPGVELRIGADDEVLVRGPMVTAGALGPDGWLHTGDRGRLDGDGRLYVDGRIKELIVTGGENVAPLEVERALMTHPAVEDAGVAARADREWGETVAAFVVLRRPVEPEELRAWCRERLAPFKVPKSIQPVNELPRNEAGKLLRDELAARDG